LKREKRLSFVAFFHRLPSPAVAPRRRAEGCPLFGPYATAWRETYSTTLKHKASRDKLKRVINVFCKPLHKLRMDEIATDHVVKLVLAPIWQQVENARETRQRLSLIFQGGDLPTSCATTIRRITKAGYAPSLGRPRSAGAFAVITRRSRITICPT